MYVWYMFKAQCFLNMLLESYNMMFHFVYIDGLASCLNSYHVRRHDVSVFTTMKYCWSCSVKYVICMFKRP